MSKVTSGRTCGTQFTRATCKKWRPQKFKWLVLVELEFTADVSYLLTLKTFAVDGRKMKIFAAKYFCCELYMFMNMLQ